MKFIVTLVLFGSTLLPSYALAEEPSENTENIVIAQLQTDGAGTGTASEEYVLLFNPSLQDTIVSNWCIEYSSAADNVGFKVCIDPPDTTTELVLEAGGFMSFATSSFVVANSNFQPDILFSGGMSAVSGHLRLFNGEDVEVDKVGWGAALNPEGSAASSHSSGQVLSRNFLSEGIDSDDNAVDFSSQAIKETIVSGLYEQEIIVDLCLNIEGIQVEFPTGFLADERSECFEDTCPNLDSLQISVPVDYEKLNMSDECTLIPLEDATLLITELLPNAPGADSGQEFIEVYNPNTETVNLLGYRIQIGPNFTKEYIFNDRHLLSGEYTTFSDYETGIVLPNSSGVVIRLVTPAGNIVSESSIYLNAPDDSSWAEVEDQWVWTNQMTPGAPNKSSLDAEITGPESETDVFLPCPTGKFRNLETNRCKNVESAVSQLVPCDSNQFRNPETNRCNKILSSSSSLTPCNPGQVRNLETNRCRSSAASSSNLQPCGEGQERNPDTNRCRKISVLSAADSNLTSVTDIPVQNTDGKINWVVISGALVSTLGYMIYEWRSELRQKISLLKLHA